MGLVTSTEFTAPCGQNAMFELYLMRFVELLGLLLLVFLVGVAALSPLRDGVVGCLQALLAVLARTVTTT